MENTYVKETNIETPKRFNRSTREHDVCQDCALGRWPHRNCSVGCMMAFDIKFLQNLSHLFADHFHLGLKSCSSCFLDFFYAVPGHLNVSEGKHRLRDVGKDARKGVKVGLKRLFLNEVARFQTCQQCRVLRPERSWPVPTSGLQQ